MSDYTPDTDVIRQAVTFERNRVGEPRTIKVEAFERWLAAHDAEVAATAMEHAAEWLVNGENAGIIAYPDLIDRAGLIDAHEDALDDPAAWLLIRAAEYRKTETEGK